MVFLSPSVIEDNLGVSDTINVSEVIAVVVVFVSYFVGIMISVL